MTTEIVAGGQDRQQQAVELVAGLLSAPSGRLSHWRRRIRLLPPASAVSELTAALKRAADAGSYQRVANTLAKLGGAPAMQALSAEVLEKGRYPGLAIRALDLAGTVETVDALLDLLDRARRPLMRRAARALARKRIGRAIGPICRHARLRNGELDKLTVAVLRMYGRPHQLLDSILTSTGLPLPGRLEAILAVEAIPRLLGRMDVQRFLDRYADEVGAGSRDEARALARMYRDKTTLLRPSERAADKTLVRPARSPDRTPSERLLIPAGGAQAQEADGSLDAETERPGALARIWATLKDVLDG